MNYDYEIEKQYHPENFEELEKLAQDYLNKEYVVFPVDEIEDEVEAINEFEMGELENE